MSKKKDENRVLRALHRELKGLSDNKLSESFDSESQSAMTLRQNRNSINEFILEPAFKILKKRILKLAAKKLNLLIQK